MSQVYFLAKDMVLWQDLPCFCFFFFLTTLKFQANLRAKISNAKIRRVTLESVWYVFLPANLFLMVRIYNYIK